MTHTVDDVPYVSVKKRIASAATVCD